MNDALTTLLATPPRMLILLLRRRPPPESLPTSAQSYPTYTPGHRDSAHIPQPLLQTGSLQRIATQALGGTHRTLTLTFP
jgi:hypothetical protein